MTFFNRKSLLAFLGLAGLLSAGMAQASATVPAPTVLINEVNPASGWIELRNSSSSAINLADWSLNRLKNPTTENDTEQVSIALPASIPAGGLVVLTGTGIHSAGDLLNLNSPIYAWTNQSLSYGNVTPTVAGDVEISAPTSAGDSIVADGVQNWKLASSTRGWFNDNNPSWSTLSAQTNGISSSLYMVSDPTAAGSVYFRKSGVGEISFASKLNLTDSASVATLQNLSSLMSFGTGKVVFSPVTGSTLDTAAANVTMLGLPVYKNYSLSDLTVTNTSGTKLDEAAKAALISNFQYATSSGSGVLTFTTQHFTTFEVDAQTAGDTTSSGAVSLIAPAAGAQVAVGDSLTLTASTTLTDDQTTVVFYVKDGSGTTIAEINGTKDSTGSTAGRALFNGSWQATTATGTYQVLAVASFDGQSYQTDGTSISVVASGSDTTAPTGTIVSPSDNSTATGTIRIAAAASDTESSIAKVTFYLDGDVELGTVTTPGSDGYYEITWTPVGTDIADGTHNLSAKIWDSAGNHAETNAVALTTDGTLPVGTITYSTTAATQNNVTAFLSINRPVVVTNNNGSTTYTFTDNGTFTFNFLDDVGHTGTVVATVNNIDRDNPVITGLSPVPGSYVTSDTKITFTNSGYVSTRCQILSPNWASPCSDLQFSKITGWGNLAEGEFQMVIEGTDAAGNVGSTTVTYIKDVTPPDFLDATATDATHLVLGFSEDLQTDDTAEHYLGASDFRVLTRQAGATEATEDQITAIAETNGVVTLTLATALTSGEALAPCQSDTDQASLCVYLNPFKPMSIADLAGNVYTPSTATSVIDAIVPKITNAFTTGSKDFVVAFDHDLNNSILASDFSVYVKRSGKIVNLGVSGVGYSNRVVTISLDDKIIAGDEIHYSIVASSSVVGTNDVVFNQGKAYTGTVSNLLTSASSGGGGGGGGSSTTVSGTVLGATVFRFNKDLTYCQTDSDVMELQKRLMAEGYMATSTLTSYFGPVTLDGVKKYQAANSLPVTGFVGPLTREILNKTALNDLQAQIDAIYEQLVYIQTLLLQTLGH